MKIATISVSENGLSLAMTLAEKMCGEHEVKSFCFWKYCNNSAVEPFTNGTELVAKIFGEFDALVFFCACGIAVRTIAPHIRSKLTDPAVVVVDDGGQFAIPILSGHIGGANALAKQIAEKIGAVPVITTATDVHGKFSPDLFAKANDLILDDLNVAKEIAAAVLRGESIAVVSAFDMINIPKEIFREEICRFGIFINQKPEKSAEHFPPVTLEVLAKNIVLGIGCKRGVTADVIERQVNKAFELTGYDLRQVVEIATIDIKRDEEGLLEFAERRGLPIRFLTAAELMSVPAEVHGIKGSDFVMKTTGADNVCERAALFSSGEGGRLLIPKCCLDENSDGVTVAAAAKPLIIDFGKMNVTI